MVTTSTLEFIEKITQHISPKGFRTVRRYEVYLRTKNKIAREIVNLYNFIKQMSVKNLLEQKKNINIGLMKMNLFHFKFTKLIDPVRRSFYAYEGCMDLCLLY